jgi:hypothetical protein
MSPRLSKALAALTLTGVLVGGGGGDRERGDQQLLVDSVVFVILVEDAQLGELSPHVGTPEPADAVRLPISRESRRSAPGLRNI